MCIFNIYYVYILYSNVLIHVGLDHTSEEIQNFSSFSLRCITKMQLFARYLGKRVWSNKTCMNHMAAPIPLRCYCLAPIFNMAISLLVQPGQSQYGKHIQEQTRIFQIITATKKKNAGNVRSWSHSSAIRNWKGGLLDCLLQVALGPVDLRMPLNYCWLGVCFKLPAILFTSVDHVHPSSMFPKIQASLFLSLLLETSPPIKFCPRFALYIFLYLQELSCVQMEERQKLRSSGPSQAAFSAEGNMEPAHPAEFCSSYSKITKNNV